MARRARSVLATMLSRAGLVLTGALLVGGGTYLALTLAGLAPAPSQTWPALGELPVQLDMESWLFWAAAAFLLVVVGALLVVGSMRQVAERIGDQWFLLSGVEDDVALGGVTVAVSRRSIDAIIARAAQHEQGVLQVVPQAQLGEDGWDIHCLVHVWAGVGLTGVADRLRTRIGDDLEHHTNIPVAQLRIDLELGQPTKRRRVA